MSPVKFYYRCRSLKRSARGKNAEIGRVPVQGQAIIVEELEIGLRSLAVPIRNVAGRVVAALNTGVQTSRISCEKFRKSFCHSCSRCSGSWMIVV